MVFQNYCTEDNIVSEFICFHPIVRNLEGFQSIYELGKIRKIVGTDIQIFEYTNASEFSKSTRKTTRQALNSDVGHRVTEKPDDISSFIEIYYSTMDRTGATDYYYFNDQYFKTCLGKFKNNIILVEALLGEKVIATGFYFVYNKTIHAHLSGT